MQNRIGLSVAGFTELYNQSAPCSVFCNFKLTTEKEICVLRIILLTAEFLHHFPCCKILTMAVCDMSPCLRLFLLVTEYPAHFPLSIILAEQREMQTVNRLKAWLAPHRWCQNVKVKTVKIKFPRWFWTFVFSEDQIFCDQIALYVLGDARCTYRRRMATYR